MYTPNEANGWLLEGTICECDGASDGPGWCENHDLEAMYAYYGHFYNSARPIARMEDSRAAYELRSPKHPDCIGF